MLNEKIIHWSLQQEGCPICIIACHSVQRYGHWFLHEYYKELSTLQQIEEGGLCSAHGAELIQLAQPHHLVTIYRYLLGKKTEKVQGWLRENQEEGETEPQESGWVANIIASLTGSEKGDSQEPEDLRHSPDDDCLFCATFAKNASRALRVLATTLEHNDGQKLFAQSTGLCLNHFNQLIPLLPEGIDEVVVSMQLEKIEELRFRLREYDRKLRMENSQDPAGLEQDSWLTAAHLYTGAWPSLLSKERSGSFPNILEEDRS